MIDEEYANRLLNMTDEEAADILQRFYELYSTPVARKNGKTLIQLPIHAALLKAIEKLKGSD